MKAEVTSRRFFPLYDLRVFAVAVLLLSACDKYEPTRRVIGTYTPRQCVTLQAVIPGGAVSHHKTIHPVICQPMRVTELGFYTYGGGWSRPGLRAEVARLEFADVGVLIETADLNATGALEYTDPPPPARGTLMNIYGIVGTCLLILSGLSGIALFVRAIGAKEADRSHEEGRRSTLWGLFLVGLVAGLILVKISS
jgi:hypothetical protein